MYKHILPITRVLHRAKASSSKPWCTTMVSQRRVCTATSAIPMPLGQEEAC